MSDINCPYCDAEIDICHDEGQGYEEDKKHSQECSNCERTFVFTTSIIFHYKAAEAPCLNEGDHEWEETKTFPRVFTEERCRICDECRPVTESRRAELEKAAAEKLAAAQARAEQVNALEVTIVSKAGDEGKLFGSIGVRDVADAITAAGVETAKSEVRLPLGAIRETGEFEIAIHLHTDVDTNIKVVVIAEA